MLSPMVGTTNRRERQRHARGQGLLEYGLVLALIALVVIVTVAVVGRRTAGTLCQVAGALGSCIQGKVTVSGTTTTPPYMMLAAPDGGVWFGEQSVGPNGYIGRVSPSGQLTECWFVGGGTVNEILGLAFDANGDIWFTDRETRQVGKFHPAQCASASVVPVCTATLPGGYSPSSIIAGPDGAVWLTEGISGGAAGIGRVTLDCQPITTPWSLSTGADPRGIIVGPDNRLWVTEQGNGNVVSAAAITQATTPVVGSANASEFPVRTGSYPYYLANGPDGAVWLTEEHPTLGNRIARITTAGAVTEYSTTAAGCYQPWQIARGPDGAMWFACLGSAGNGVVDKTGSGVGRITISGAITMFATDSSAGRPLGIASAPAGLWFVSQDQSNAPNLNPPPNHQVFLLS